MNTKRRSDLFFLFLSLTQSAYIFHSILLFWGGFQWLPLSSGTQTHKKKKKRADYLRHVRLLDLLLVRKASTDRHVVLHVSQRLHPRGQSSPATPTERVHVRETCPQCSIT